MSDTVWTEERIEGLLKEDNTFERKGSVLFGADGEKGGIFRDELAKQLSAFANSGGGSIILGADDKSGMIDGGLPLIAKGRTSTKDYLEDIIPGLTDEKITGFAVIEIERSVTTSRIKEGNAVFVIEVPDSDRAPHQSTRDQKYYVRLGSKSQPASHRIIEDIRNRTRHPTVDVVGAATTGINFLPYQAGWGQLSLTLEIVIRNSGRMRATNVCLELSASTALEGRHRGGEEVCAERQGRPGTVLLELAYPVYPSMEITVRPTIAMSCHLKKHDHSATSHSLDLTIENKEWGETNFTATLYADSASAKSRDFKLRDMDIPHRQVEELLMSEPLAHWNL